MTDRTPPMTHATGMPGVDNTNIQTAGPRGPALLQDVWLIEKLAHFDREVIPERRMHAKGWGAHGIFTVTNDITRYTKAKIFGEVGKQTPLFVRFSTVAGERGARGSAERRMPTALSAVLPSNSIPRRATGTSSATTRPSSSSAIRCASRISTTRSSVIRAPACARRTI